MNKEDSTSTNIDKPLSKKEAKAKEKADKLAAKEAEKAAKVAAKGKKTKTDGSDGQEMSTDEKSKLLRQMLGQKFGSESIYNANTSSADFIKVYTGIAELDFYTGGISLGRMIELVGASQGGKSTLAVIIAEAISKFLENVNKMNGPSLYLDGERTLSRAAIARLGVDPSVFEIKKFMTGEEALESASIANKNNLVSSLVIDSIPTLMPEKGVGDDANFSGQQMGNRAKLISDNIVKLVAESDASGTTVICVNQKRKQLGTYGAPEKGAGGKAFEYFVDTRIDLTGTDKLMNGKECIGRMVRVRLTKSKSRAPEKEFMLRFIFDTGFDKLESLINLGIKLGLVSQSGAYFAFGENKVQGKENLKKILTDNKTIYDELHTLVYSEIEKIEEESKVYDPNRLFKKTDMVDENNNVINPEPQVIPVDFKNENGQADFDETALG